MCGSGWCDGPKSITQLAFLHTLAGATSQQTLDPALLAHTTPSHMMEQLLLRYPKCVFWGTLGRGVWCVGGMYVSVSCVFMEGHQLRIPGPGIRYMRRDFHVSRTQVTREPLVPPEHALARPNDFTLPTRQQQYHSIRSSVSCAKWSTGNEASLALGPCPPR